MTQTCVVSLEPVESTLEVPVEVEFWPIPMIDDLAASLDEAGKPRHARLARADRGRQDRPWACEIYETLATALDPYPKREGVSFEWSEASGAGAADEQPESPFAALKRLK